MDKLFGLLAVFGFAAALIVHGLTFFHVDLIEKFPSVWALHVGIFIVFVPFVFSARRAPGGFQGSNLRAILPEWAIALLAVTFVYAIVNFVLFFFLSEGGVPDIRDGRFVLHDHGRVIRELTEHEYHVQRSYVLRGFSGHWLIFHLIPAAYFLFRKSSSDGA